MQYRKILVLLILLSLVPTVEAQLGENLELGETMTKTQVFNVEKFIDWGPGYTWLFKYFYLNFDDIPVLDVGKWRHVETHEEGIGFNVTVNRYINWSGDWTILHKFNMSKLSFSWSTHSITSYNVTEGFNHSISSNATVSKDELENGISIQFGLEQIRWVGAEYWGCTFITSLNITATFVSTFEYWYWVCGGVIVSDIGELRLDLLSIPILGLISLVLVMRKEKGDRQNGQTTSDN